MVNNYIYIAIIIYIFIIIYLFQNYNNNEYFENKKLNIDNLNLII